MVRFVLTKRARKDLAEIWCFVAQDDPEAADRLMDLFDDRFRLLAGAPRMGRVHVESEACVRAFPVGRYVVHYRQRRGCITILRVLSACRDVSSIAFS